MKNLNKIKKQYSNANNLKEFKNIEDNEVVKWKCSHNHIVEKTKNDKEDNPICPVCSKLKILDGNTLANKNPELAKEWNYDKNKDLNPEDIAPKSGKKVWWICEEGHEWKATILDRSYNRGCPYCSGHRVGYGNSLGAKNPKLAKEWHPTKNKDLTAFDVTTGSSKKVWWLCLECGNEWEQRVSARSEEKECKECKWRKRSLAYKFPEIAKEWHPTKNKDLTPEKITARNTKKVWWQCENCNHEWEATVANRTDGNRCPYCKSLHKHPSHTLTVLFPEVANKWDNSKNGKLKPTYVTPGSGKEVWWQCEKNHSWKNKIVNQVNNNACPFCKE